MTSASPHIRNQRGYRGSNAIGLGASANLRSLRHATEGDESHERLNDHRLFAASSDPSASRSKRRQRQSDAELLEAQPFEYRTVADGDAFRLAELLPGTGSEPVRCNLRWESSRHPPKISYNCLSYCWGEDQAQSAAILCDGYRFSITKNLLVALQNIRKPRDSVLVWVDQICINQCDLQERGHQVSMIKRIFRHAKMVIVWLGEEDDRSVKLCEYARKMRRGEDSPRNVLNRIMTQRQLHDAIQKLLQRPWFSRVWVIPEVALARFVVVHCGRSHLSWDNFVRLIRDTTLPPTAGFDKQSALLGNTRQRIAIITQMIASQRARLVHTDITQLLILAKASQASEKCDKVYAFYGLTLLRTFPDYERPAERVYSDIARMYINSIRWEDYYSRWHGLNDQKRTQQLMSILYSAGALHQHLTLPSWVPDWTFAWHLAPIWCRATSNAATRSARDEWSVGIRSVYRAGGNKLETFEVIDGPHGTPELHLSILVVDAILTVSETTPASTPSLAQPDPMMADAEAETVDTPALRYGRLVFETKQGLVGLATPGVHVGDIVAIPLGGDVPVALRPCPCANEQSTTVYQLLCECFVQSEHVMKGDVMRTDWARAEDIVLL